MSYDAEKWARAQKVGNSTAKAVLKELAYRFNGETGLCYPSLKTLCEDLEIKKRDTVLAAVQRLEAAGFIQREIERSESGEILRTLYTFPTFNPEEWADKQNEETYPEKRDTVSQKSGHRIPKKGTPYPENGDTVSQKSGDRYPENRDVTRNTEQGKEQGIEQGSMSPLPSDDLVLSPDTEQPKTKAKRSKTTKSYDFPKPDGVDDQVWADFVTHRRTKKAAITATAIKRIQKQAYLAGITLQEAFEVTIERNWQTFKAEWWQNATQTLRAPQRSNFNRPLSREQMALDDDF